MRYHPLYFLLIFSASASMAQTDMPGCTYPWACNFNPYAYVDDGTCLLPPVGCAWPNNPNVGCTYPGADNYSAEAIWDDGSCIYQAVGSCPTDVNNNGTTEVQDILLLLGSFGSECVTPQFNIALDWQQLLQAICGELGYCRRQRWIFGPQQHDCLSRWRLWTCEQFLGRLHLSRNHEHQSGPGWRWC